MSIKFQVICPELQCVNSTACRLAVLIAAESIYVESHMFEHITYGCYISRVKSGRFRSFDTKTFYNIPGDLLVDNTIEHRLDSPSAIYLGKSSHPVRQHIITDVRNKFKFYVWLFASLHQIYTLYTHIKNRYARKISRCKLNLASLVVILLSITH